ncbi:hypothetical protein ACOSP6_05190 [Tenacibaculum sp. MEBiC06402]|uniref:hypothetical protein n=1 Tax=unclassified Tenacibaculum TaxID=2635139 RepID=UPI003B9D587D
MNILEKYNIKINNKSISSRDLNKQILVHFLGFWNNIKDIEEDLLPELMLVIDGVLEFNDIGADVVGVAYVEKQKTRLIGSDLGHPDFTIYTDDFHQIILEWLSVLKK